MGAFPLTRVSPIRKRGLEGYKMSTWKLGALVAAAIALVIASGCGNKEEGTDNGGTPPATTGTTGTTPPATTTTGTTGAPATSTTGTTPPATTTTGTTPPATTTTGK